MDSLSAFHPDKGELMGIKKTEVCSSIFDVLMLKHSHKSHALLLIDGGSVFICVSLECQVVVLIGSDLIFLNVDVTCVTTFFLSSNCY